jgi:hypothetical protein
MTMDFMAEDRAWFRRHPRRKYRRRPLIEGEFPPSLCVAPPGYRIEVLVQMAVEFSNGDSLRLRWPMLVPIEESLQ